MIHPDTQTLKSFITSSFLAIFCLPTVFSEEPKVSVTRQVKAEEKPNLSEIPRPTPEVVKLRKQIREYLAKQAKRPIPRSLQEITGPIDPGPLTQDYSAAKNDRPKLYLLFGRDLALVDRLLIHKDLEVRRSAVLVVHWILVNIYVLQDYPLAVSVCDAYQMVNFALANPLPGRASNRDGMQQSAIAIYGKAQQYVKQEAVLRMALETPSEQSGEDATRIALAKCLSKQRRYDEAIEELGRISDFNINMRNGAHEYARSLAAQKEAYEKEQAAKGVKKK
ncbi:MAG: hypothetical protein JWP89_4232 [Schlesneria sp.]|nr:hypothetical protein [Schlesneria sp.]